MAQTVPVEGQFDDAEDDRTCPECISSSRVGVEDTTASVEHVKELSLEDEEDETWEEDEEGYSDEDEDYEWENTSGDITKKYKAFYQHQQPNAQHTRSGGRTAAKYQVHNKNFVKLSSKISVERYAGPRLLGSAGNMLAESNRKADMVRQKVRDKSDRATAEQVMDPRTRMILFKLLSRQIISEVNGCISTGKEANVYHAAAKDDVHLAIKVYKTSILLFKDRDKYVTGEFRFRHGYCKHNPRKMVKTWAEKEMRNLTRIYQSGIPCPEPVLLRSHVLVMGFIGKEGWAAPKLKDASLPESKMLELYTECIQIMRTLYQVCKLVHADLSEYNMLYHEGKLYLIDVSQSVEHDHPHALEFLRTDCTNITDYFGRKGVCGMTMKELFDFVTDPTIDDDNITAYLDRAMEMASQRTVEDITEQQKVEEQVFKQAYIPRTLDEVVDFERDLKRMAEGVDTGLSCIDDLVATGAESLEATHHAEGAVRSTAGVESVCFLHNVHSRLATSDGNTAQRTSTVERSPSASVSSSARNRGTPISSRRSA
ncbi:Serine/threonine-protein kinase RIO1 [Lamellibrachia satsuma]|nr:Serine/threonine-protein kinase RIO1 [Lamellibrachia satsuma]